MLTCKQASELMSHGMDARLPIRKRISLKIHLMMCHGCTNFMRQAGFLHRAARRWRGLEHSELPRLSPDAKQRIVIAMRERIAEDQPANGTGKESP